MPALVSFLKTLFRRKNLQKEQGFDTPLRRCLTLPHLILYSIAHMAGAGIYVLTGKMVRDQAGAAASISYIFAAISAFFTGLCYAEFSTLFPKAGSGYVYSYLMLGELPAFIIGWTTISDFVVGMASVAKAFSGTIDLLTHGAIVNWTITNVGAFSSNSTHYLDKCPDLVAFSFLIFLIIVTLTGAHISLTVNGVLTVIQVVCLIAVCISCFIYGDVKKRWSPEVGGFAPYGFTGIIEGASIAVFAFSGFESLTNASEEMKDPRRSLPRALFISLFITTILYIFASLGLSVIIPRENLDYKSPYVGAFRDLDHPILMWVAAVGTLLATGATKISSMYVIPRMFYAIASDGLIFTCLAHVEKRTKVPIVALLFSGSICCLLALFFNIQTLADFTTMGILLSYSTIGLNLIILRYIHQDQLQRAWVLTESDMALSEEEGDGDGTDEAHISLFGKKASYSDDEQPHTPTVDMSPSPRYCFQSLFEKYPSLKTRRAIILIVLVYLTCSFIISVLIDYYVSRSNVWMWIGLGVTATCMLVSFLMLSFYKPDYRAGAAFKAPWMPLAPCMTIFINILLLVHLPSVTWIRFAVWSCIGLFIYIVYGYRHSAVGRGYLSSNVDKVSLLNRKSIEVNFQGEEQ